MYHVIETKAFSKWLHSLKDSVTKARLLKRLRQVSLGNLGDVKSIGDGVFEMPEFFGPGWRMYYVQRGGIIIVMLGGGTKSTQDRDIDRAIALAQELNYD